MKHAGLLICLAIAFAPSALAGGYDDLDNAMSALSNGFERGDSSAIVAGVGSSDRVELQFPGLTERSGFFGRDQAAFVLDDVFKKASPTRFEQVSARKVSAQKQYHITGSWTISPSGGKEQRDVYIILQDTGEGWTIISIRSAGR